MAPSSKTCLWPGSCGLTKPHSLRPASCYQLTTAYTVHRYFLNAAWSLRGLSSPHAPAATDSVTTSFLQFAHCPTFLGCYDSEGHLKLFKANSTLSFA
mmetsp:Transcript_15879/g.29009  ORF Transcript_15879/g.29009 Transcript_15879/m.29009 type:complete len:98 (+) Transcript_15879:94-387(+)